MSDGGWDEARARLQAIDRSVRGGRRLRAALARLAAAAGVVAALGLLALALPAWGGALALLAAISTLALGLSGLLAGGPEDLVAAGWRCDRALATADELASACDLTERGAQSPLVAALRRRATQRLLAEDPARLAAAAAPLRLGRAPAIAGGGWLALVVAIALIGWPLGDPAAEDAARRAAAAASLEQAADGLDAELAERIKHLGQRVRKAGAKGQAAEATAKELDRVKQARDEADKAAEASETVADDPTLAATREAAREGDREAQRAALEQLKRSLRDSQGAGESASAALEDAARLVGDDLADQLRRQARLLARGEVDGEGLVDALRELERRAAQSDALQLAESKLERALEGLGGRPAGSEPTDDGEPRGSVAASGQRARPLTPTAVMDAPLPPPAEPLQARASQRGSERRWPLEDDALIRALADRQGDGR